MEKIVNIKDYIIVKDNFFNDKVYNEIIYDISRLTFKNRSIEALADGNKSVYQRIYFSTPLNFNHFAVKEMKNILKNMGLNVKCFEHNYFLSTKHEEATPHNDSIVDVNCLIYLKGDNVINSGTGFYDKINEKFTLNRHIGFKENRAIIFDSKIYHASLQFNNGAKPRYVMSNFLNYNKE